jgi:HK97 family phage major capsid protein
MFQPPVSGFAQSPQGALFGRPVLPTQHCNSLGTSGDIVLADLSQYLAISRADGLTQQTSMHLWFDQDLVAYKFTFRLAGQPWRSTPITPRAGSNTLSHFVTLEDRP